MSSATKQTMSCSQCSKRFVWQPAMAGKRVRCTCGQVLAQPSQPMLEALEVDSLPIPELKPLEPADLYDLIEPEAPKLAPAKSAPAKAAFLAPLDLDDDGLNCPECKHEMEPGRVICSACGFNFRTGQCPQAPPRAVRPTKSQASAAAPALPPVFPLPVDFRPARGRYTMEQQGPPVRRIMATVALVSLIAGAFVWHHLAASSAAVLNSGKGEDPEVNEMIADDGASELHHWFAEDPARIAGDYSPKQAIAKADELQAMGARKVLAFGSRMTLALAVELPDQPAQRAALFKWENRFASDRYYKPDKDVGQHYLLLRLHP